MLTTSWPGKDHDKVTRAHTPKQRRKRPRGKAEREASRAAILQSKLPEIHAMARRWELKNNAHLFTREVEAAARAPETRTTIAALLSERAREGK
jgi:hypothetical protein